MSKAPTRTYVLPFPGPSPERVAIYLLSPPPSLSLLILPGLDSSKNIIVRSHQSSLGW